jgi:hypothetical protein
MDQMQDLDRVKVFTEDCGEKEMEQPSVHLSRQI